MSVIVQSAPQDQVVPSECLLTFPPFPRPPPGASLISYSAFTPRGSLHQAGPSRLTQVFAGPEDYPPRLDLLDITTEVDDAVPTAPAPKSAQQPAIAINRNGLAAVRPSDAWLIGENGASWEEPESSSISSYDLSIAPFDRLIAAVRDFYSSRRMAFERQRNKLLFTLLRHAFGLHKDRVANDPHWAGSPNEQDWETRAAADEACVLLTRPMTAVRGFLATARREAEAGWDFEPALQLAKITSALMSFIDHHQVLPDIPDFAQAVALARAAPARLQDAEDLEEALWSPLGWNRAAWTMWGGVYGGPERGGREKEAQPASVSSDAARDDGGWTVQEVPDHRPTALTPSEVHLHLTHALSPLKVESIRLKHYLPFARRKIIAAELLNPQGGKAAKALCPNNTSMCCLVTVPAPWTPEEKWKSRPRFDNEGTDHERDGYAPVIKAELAEAFDQESPTLEEPEIISLLVESSSLAVDRLQDYVGAGLRGRWALMTDGSKESWVFKAKDFVLPNFWQGA